MCNGNLLTLTLIFIFLLLKQYLISSPTQSRWDGQNPVVWVHLYVKMLDDVTIISRLQLQKAFILPILGSTQLAHHETKTSKQTGGHI